VPKGRLQGELKVARILAGRMPLDPRDPRQRLNRDRIEVADRKIDPSPSALASSTPLSAAIITTSAGNVTPIKRALRLFILNPDRAPGPDCDKQRQPTLKTTPRTLVMS
jgi:hypothetical protein